MPRKTARAATGVKQPAVVAKGASKSSNSASASSQTTRASVNAGTKQKTTKHGRPENASAPKVTTKQQTILDLLGRPDGATVAAIMQATGWQQHSVRGFLAGTVRKKLGLTLMSEKVDDQRVYRVLAAKPAKARAAAAAAAAATPSAG